MFPFPCGVLVLCNENRLILAVLTRTKGERMTEEGTLSIVRRGNTYQVRYASNNPHTMDRQLYTCIDKEHLEAFLPQVGIAPWYIIQVCTDLRKSGCAVLLIVLRRFLKKNLPLQDGDAGLTKM